MGVADFTSISMAAGAGGTLSAAAAAVYYGTVRPQRRRPKLAVAAFQQIDAPTNVDGKQITARWLLMKISNAPKHDAAEDVQVRLVSVKAGKSPEELIDRELPDFALKTTGSDAPGMLIPPGGKRVVNIGYVTKQEDGYTFTLDLSKPPAGDRQHWDAPFAEIALAVTARNADATEARLLIETTAEELVITCSQ